MSTKLIPGDRVYFIQKGRKLRAVVTDSLSMKTRGKELEVPVVRPMNRKKATCKADNLYAALKIRWIKRSELRKLPE